MTNINTQYAKSKKAVMFKLCSYRKTDN